VRETLAEIYARLAAHYGETHWWPGETPFEVSVGAVLTQNTAWSNVEKAIANLKAARLLSPRAMAGCANGDLEAAIRPSGYYRQKAIRLRGFCEHLLTHYGGSMARMARRPAGPLREELLALHGIGPETADDILLYACGVPVFVVDAYTRRILSRHGLVEEKIGYDGLQALFHDHVDRDLHVYKEYHGLIVWTGKDFCRTKARCEGCPLAPLLPADS